MCGIKNLKVSFHHKERPIVIFSFDFQNNRPVAVLMFVVPYRKCHGIFVWTGYQLKILQLYKRVYLCTWTLGDFSNAQKIQEML